VSLLKHRKQRGLNGVCSIALDACPGLVEAAAEFDPQARWQRCTAHPYTQENGQAALRKASRSACVGESMKDGRVGSQRRLRRRRVSILFRTSLGTAPGPTTRRKGQCAKSKGEPMAWGPSLAANHVSGRRAQAYCGNEMVFEPRCRNDTRGKTRTWRSTERRTTD